MKSRILITAALLTFTLAQGAHLSTAARGAQPGPGATDAVDQTQRFITVDGADLKSKLDAAIKQARAASQSAPFWVAYSFDVRPGVGVDPNGTSFNGNMMSQGSVTLFFGTSNGVPIETRNLGVFVLLQPADRAITRIEVYNLERPREYSGYAVYWLGRGGNQESLDYLKSIADSNKAKRVAENATMAIGLHDAPQVSPILKELARRSALTDVREGAIFWLGYIGGEQTFLADFVRNEQENADVREAAAAAIGRGRDRASLTLLQTLYGQVTSRDVKEQILHSIAKNDDQKAATDFLVKVVKTDTDRELRETAVHMLGRVPGTQALLVDIVRNEQEHADVREAAVNAIAKGDDPKAIASLQGLYKSVTNRDVKESIINVVTKNQDQSAAMSFLTDIVKDDPDRDLREEAVSKLSRLPGTQSLLVEIARNEKEDRDVREAAISAITRNGDATSLSTLQDLYTSISDRDLKEGIISAIAKNPNEEAALNFLIKVAESDAERELREEAISKLARSSSPRSLETLNRIANTDNDAELQEEAVGAISKRPSDQAVPLLIQIAKTHPRVEIREEAIHRLGRMNDERAREFLKQVISNDK